MYIKSNNNMLCKIKLIKAWFFKLCKKHYLRLRGCLVKQNLWLVNKEAKTYTAKYNKKITAHATFNNHDSKNKKQIMVLQNLRK